MKEAELRELAAAWIEYFRLVELKRNAAAVEWATDRVLDITYESPEHLLEFVLEALRQRPSPDVMAVLAAGPLEDYLAKLGDAVIGRVEEIARTNSEFRHLLGGVWKNAMSDNVWARVRACRGEAW